MAAWSNTWKFAPCRRRVKVVSPVRPNLFPLEDVHPVREDAGVLPPGVDDEHPDAGARLGRGVVAPVNREEVTLLLPLGHPLQVGGVGVGAVDRGVEGIPGLEAGAPLDLVDGDLDDAP